MRRKKRVKSLVFGYPKRPRLSIFRSNKHLFAQIIDDTCGKTILSLRDNKKEYKEWIYRFPWDFFQNLKFTRNHPSPECESGNSFSIQTAAGKVTGKLCNFKPMLKSTGKK